MNQRHVVVGISGASGIPVAIKVLQVMQTDPSVFVHLVISDSGKVTIESETEYSLNEVIGLADEVNDNRDITADIASGSFPTMGMLIVPCSMKTVAGINSGYSDSLLLRAADVTLKESRKLVLAVRESPFSQIHLRNLYELSQCGAVILPLVVNYYSRPQNINDLTTQLAGKILRQFEITCPDYFCWTGVDKNASV